MKVLKFGGASVNCSDGVKNLANITSNIVDNQIIVVSAMGKMTNELEKLTSTYFYGDASVEEVLENIESFHLNIIENLFDENDEIYSVFEKTFTGLKNKLTESPSLSFDFEYDQIVPYGEILSTQIISEYLNKRKQNNKWIDVRNCIKTDCTFREGRIDWALSEKMCQKYFNFQSTFKYVTQGFIAGTETNLTTTLGREGSDYTAAILANLLDAESVTIWKDVPGIMNADPKEFPEAKVIKQLSYKETIELAHFGAKVIHPKTIKPLQNKYIPLFVKSFINPENQGSIVNKFDEKLSLIPIFIRKKNQILLSLIPRDFSFIAEEELGNIFATMAKYKIKFNLMQNSAISFSVCLDYNKSNFDTFIEELKERYSVLYNPDTELITIRHFTPESIERVTEGKKILVEQKNRLTARFVIETKEE